MTANTKKTEAPTRQAQPLRPARSHETVEQIEALTKADEHLRFVAEVMARSALPASLQTDLAQQIERIQARRADQNLYLAVIGEFSSGKSTFINALLREDLLKTSALVTTASATRIHAGKETCLSLRLGQWKRQVKVKAQSREITLPDFPELGSCSFQEVLHAVTADDRVAAKVSEVSLTHPSPFLGEGIVLIDTPGANALNRQHAELTRQVLEHEADAAVVIIPATVPLSQTLTDFLNSTLKPYLHRCIFVVTRMDQIRPREQEMLLNNVRERLQKTLKLKTPLVIACSAQAVLNCLNYTTAPEMIEWSNRFVEVERALLQRLRQQRVLSIAENLLRLLERLFEPLEKQLRVAVEKHEARLATIQSQTIRDLQGFASEQRSVRYAALLTAIAQATKSVEQTLSVSRTNALTTLQHRLQTVTDVETLNAVLSHSLPREFGEMQETLTTQLTAILKQLQKNTQQISADMQQCFLQEYTRLAALGEKVSVTQMPAASFSVQLNADDVLSGVRQLGQGLVVQQGKYTTGGAIGGAVVGTMVLPVIGTAVGAFVGGWLSRKFAPSVAENRTAIQTALKQDLEACYASLQTQITATLASYQRQAQATLTDRITAHVRIYQTAFDQLMDKQQRDQQRVQRLQEVTQNDLTELTRRKSALVTKQKQLSGMTEHRRS